MAGRGRNPLLPEADRANLGQLLYSEGFFGVGEDMRHPITVKSGRKSPHYLDIRPGITRHSTRTKIARALSRLANFRALERTGVPLIAAYDHIVGTPEAMTSYAAFIADRNKMRLLQPRVDMAKLTGNKSPILGQYKPGEEAAAFDDVVTDGQSKIDIINGLSAAGLNVTDYFVVLDREEGGAPHVKEVTGITITPALGVSSLVRMLAAEKVINKKQFDNVARYLDQYGEPHAQEAVNTAL